MAWDVIPDPCAPRFLLGIPNTSSWMRRLNSTESMLNREVRTLVLSFQQERQHPKDSLRNFRTPWVWQVIRIIGSLRRVKVAGPRKCKLAAAIGSGNGPRKGPRAQNRARAPLGTPGPPMPPLAPLGPRPEASGGIRARSGPVRAGPGPKLSFPDMSGPVIVCIIQ